MHQNPVLRELPGICFVSVSVTLLQTSLQCRVCFCYNCSVLSARAGEDQIKNTAALCSPAYERFPPFIF